MGEEQLDLFGDAVARADGANAIEPLGARPAPEDLDDDELIAALADAGLRDAPALAAEAARRRLAAAVPALGALSRRFTGFGSRRPIPEQAAALDALVAIGGRPAAQAVAQLIGHGVFQGPTLAVAVAAAARLRAALSPASVVGLLRHADPAVRAGACRCTRPGPEVAQVLIDLLSDLNAGVAADAAGALGRMGWKQALPALKQLLRTSPSGDVIEALAAIADEEAIVLLARLGRDQPDLSSAVLAGLDGIDHARAEAAASALRRAGRA